MYTVYEICRGDFLRGADPCVFAVLGWESLWELRGLVLDRRHRCWTGASLCQLLYLALVPPQPALAIASSDRDVCRLAIAGICVMYYQLLQTLHSLMHQDNPERGGLGDMLSVVICGAQGPDKDNVHTTEMIRVMRRLSLYPIILIGCWVFGTANRMQNSANRHNPNMGLFVMHMVTNNLNGFFNSLVYGCNDSLYNKLALYCCGKENAQSPKQSEDENDGKFEVQVDEMSQQEGDNKHQVAVIAEAEVTHKPDQSRASGRTMNTI